MSADITLDLPGSAHAPRAQRLVALADALLAAAGLQARELSLLLTDNAGIAALNARWRQLNEPTDVLSFAFDEAGLNLPNLPLGDIVISVERAEGQRHDHGLSLDEELTFLLVHGFCHLRGFDHHDADEAAEMRGEEGRLLALIAPALQPPARYTSETPES